VGLARLKPFLLPLAICIVIFGFAASAGPQGSDSGRLQTAFAANACSRSEYHQFDFWLGDWEVSDFRNPGVIDAHVRVDRILNGCVLHESYQDTSGAKGESFSIYDATTSMWHQTWVTNRGRLLLIDGRMQQDAMVLSGQDLTAEGKKRLIRGTWKPVEGGVRETAVISLDNGKTWTPWFDLLFRPRRS
jgi:hypothetical protein